MRNLLVALFIIFSGLAFANPPGTYQPLLLKSGAVTIVRSASNASASAGQTSASVTIDATSCDMVVGFVTGRNTSGSMTSPSATYNSVSASVTTVVNSLNARVSIYGAYLASPSSGSHTFAFSWSGTQSGTVAGALCLKGTSGIIGTPQTASGGSGSPATVTISSNPGDLVVSGIGIAGTGSSMTSNNTSDYSNVDPGNDSVKGGASHASGATSVLMSWTVASLVDSSLIGFNIPAQ